ncbi:MAG: fructosamine kinase family protein [SAR324 cluster bacterium]|nr:fructosamine kinase family protein [SAR324 cluster bacterium]
MNPDLKSRLEEILSEPVKSTTRVSGGCIADSYKLELNSGKIFFLKLAQRRNYGIINSEAQGLDELKKVSAVNVPKIVSKDTDFLLLEWIEEGNDSTDLSMEKLGLQFAELHRFHGDRFGFQQDNFIGNSLQKNIPSTIGSDNWATFYAENRIHFQAELAEKNGYATPEMLILMERLITKIPELLSGTEDKPSLLHGDLWSGNYIVDVSGNPWLIDPAVYYGHREADLAMTSLFGGFSDIFYSAYKSAFPLVPDYAEREPLYQLYHLMNHLNLFGKTYFGQVLSVLKRYVC